MTFSHLIEVASAGLVWQNRILLVRRGNEPSKGLYAFPGGRIEPGETAEQAARREVTEETGLTAGRLCHQETLELRSGPSTGYRLYVFFGALDGGIPVAGDDATSAGWYSLQEISVMPMTESSLRIARDLLATTAASLTQS